MPSPRSRSEEHLEKLSPQEGTEKVVNIRKVTNDPVEGYTMTPLSVHTGYVANTRTSETVEEMKSQIRRRQKSSSRKKYDQARRSQIYANIFNDGQTSRRRVVSCVDLTVPEPVDSSAVVGNEEESTLTAGTQHASKIIRKIRGRHREDWLSSKTEEIPRTQWRQSGIFAPETGAHRSTSRTHKTKHPRATPIQPSPTPTNWSPYLPMPPCPRCYPVPFSASQERFYSYPAPMAGGLYYPYVPYSSDAIPTQPYPPHVVQHDLPYKYQPPQTWHSHSPQRRRPYYSPSYHTLKHTHSRPGFLSPSIEEFGQLDINECDRTVDLMEIEYAVDNGEDKSSFLTTDTVNMIVQMAKDFNKQTDRLEDVAKELKLALDARLGEKWHVVIGDDSFGSNLASLPGALANFKLGKNVFLVWQT